MVSPARSDRVRNAASGLSASGNAVTLRREVLVVSEPVHVASSAQATATVSMRNASEVADVNPGRVDRQGPEGGQAGRGGAGGGAPEPPRAGDRPGRGRDGCGRPPDPCAG